MKRILYILTALLLITATTSCNKEKNPSNKSIDISGEWHCMAEGFDAEVYVEFGIAGDFNLYQRVGEGRFRHYAGNWWVKGVTLSGNYNDGTPWGSDYSVAMLDEQTMTLTATNGSEETMTYTKESIPTTVKEECVVARSSDREAHPIL